MSAWSDAFDAAYSEPADWAPLASLLSARTGKTVDDGWLSATIDEVFVHVMLSAPCRVSDWIDPTYMPAPVQAVLSAVLSRVAANPDGVRTIQMGEFSQTMSIELEPTTPLSLYPEA